MNEVTITQWPDGSIQDFFVFVRDFQVVGFRFPQGSTPLSELDRLTDDFFTNAMSIHNRNIDNRLIELNLTETQARELYGRIR